MLKVPIGGIIMWSGTAVSIPANYHLCDGVAGTPNLMDYRFYLIAEAGDAYAVGAIGGDWYRDADHVHMTDLAIGDESSHFHHFSNLFQTGAGDTCADIDSGIGMNGTISCNHAHVANLDTGPGSAHSHGFTDANSLGAVLQYDCNYPEHYGLYFIMRMS